MTKAETQKWQIARHLIEKGTISSLEAFEKYRILRCGARIFDLREEGWQIMTDHEVKVDTFGDKKTVWRYILLDLPKKKKGKEKTK